MRTILLVTYDISPYRGSEASVSWNYVANMQHTNRLIVLYGKGKDEIELYLRTNTMPHVRFQNIAYTEITGHGFIDDIKYNLNYRKWHKQGCHCCRQASCTGKCRYNPFPKSDRF